MSENATRLSDTIDFRKHRNKWQSKSEYEDVQRIRERLDVMRTARESTCYWDNPPELEVSDSDVDSEGGAPQGSGHSWTVHWNRMQKQTYMYKSYIPGRANIKSPMTFAPAQAAKNEFSENNVGVTLFPTKESDTQKIKKLNHIIKHWHHKAAVGKANSESFSSCVDFGTSIDYVGWLTKARDVELILTGKALKEYVKKNKDDAKSKAESGKPATKKVKFVEFDDVVKIPVSIFEFYVDPNARCLRGPAYEAEDCVWRQTPSIELIRSELKASRDPFIIKENISKIKDTYTCENELSGDKPFFAYPSDISGANGKGKAEVIRYYNKINDEYAVVVNDVIVRKGPLPYNHKELPFGRHIYLPMHHQFYGIGLGALLETLQAEDETLRNLRLEQLVGEIMNPILVSGDEADNIQRQMSVLEPRKIVKVSGDVTDNTIRPLRLQTSHVDYVTMRQSLQEDAIKATGINPMRYATPNQGEAVRNNMMLMEMTQKSIKASVKNWGEGWIDEIKMVVKIMQQMYPDSRIQKLTNDGEVEDEKRYVTLKGVKLVSEEDKIKEEPIGKENISTFEIDENVLSLDGDCEYQLELDTFIPMTQGLQAQLAEKFASAILPLLTNPQVMANPAVMDIIKWIADTMGAPEKVTEMFGEESSEENVKEAALQNEEILSGVDVEGEYGESVAHILEHASMMNELLMKSMEIMAGDPMYMQNEEYNNLNKTMKTLYQHIKTDSTPKYGAGNDAMKNFDAQAQMVPPMMQQMMQQMGPQQGMPQQIPTQTMPEQVFDQSMMQQQGGEMIPPGIM